MFGVLAAVAGLIVVVDSRSGDVVAIAQLALMVPILLYAGWWLLFSGMWRREVAPPAPQPVIDGSFTTAVFDSEAVSVGPDSTTFNLDPVEEHVRSAYRESIRRPDGEAVSELRPRFRRAI